MNVSETILKLTNENGFAWGLETVMKVLRPGCLYQIKSENGRFILTEWPDNQWDDETQSYILPPTEQEIRDEYIRQKTIAECIEHFNNNPA